MYSKIKTILSLAIVSAVIASCGQSLYTPTIVDSQTTGISADTLTLGRRLYVDNCASCHSLYKPEQLTKKEWIYIMPIMQKKANCKDEQTSIIMKYLLARAKAE